MSDPSRAFCDVCLSAKDKFNLNHMDRIKKTPEMTGIPQPSNVNSPRASTPPCSPVAHGAFVALPSLAISPSAGALSIRGANHSITESQVAKDLEDHQVQPSTQHYLVY